MSEILGTASGSGGDILGTAAFENITGQGILSLSGAPTVAGAGVVEAPRVGSGALTAPGFAASGSGVVRVTGSASLSLTGVSASGSGSAVASVPGTGNIIAPLHTVSGAGVMVPPTMVGTGAIIVSLPTVSGNGSVVRTGTADINTPSVVASGSGTVSIFLPGTGNLFSPEVAVAASGSVITPIAPVINDGGNLTVTLPYLSQSADTQYPQIAAWLASFYSDVVVTNNAPLLLLVANSPISVTFSATNQWATTTLTRTVTLNVETSTSTGQLTPNPSDLRLLFPYFNNPAWTDDVIDSAIERAMCHISASNYGRLKGECRLKAIYLMAAHLLYIADQASSGGTPGVITSSSVDKVAVSFMAPPAKSMWQWWLAQTPYGAELQSLLSTKAAGGFYIPGSLERAGFRKAGGRF